MLTLAATLVALAIPAAPPAEAPRPQASDTASPDAAPVAAAARTWLEQGDAARWDAAYAGTTAAFRTANTPAGWQAASEKVRVPLGRMLSRTLVTQQEVPIPPNGGWTVRFRTDFEHKRGAIETLTLVREGGVWKVAGIYLE
jgi:hypothetical protein